MALLTAGAVVGSAAIAAVAVHLLGYLQLGGYSATTAAAVTGSLGVVQVGGRVVLTAAARRLPTAAPLRSCSPLKRSAWLRSC